MEGSKLGLLVARLFQLLCGVVVLGTSADLATAASNSQALCHAEGYGGASCSLDGFNRAVDFGAFVGAWGLLAALVGLAAIFVAAIPWVAVVVLDALAAIFFLAAGIDTAVWLGSLEGRYICDVSSKCSEIRADDAFEFLGLIVTLVILVLVFLWQRRR